MWGKITEMTDAGAIVDFGESTRRKPMRPPKGSDAKVGDAVAVEQIGGVHTIISVYGGESDGEQQQDK